MKKYIINPPDLSGILSHDFLFFEGVNCSNKIYKILDSGYMPDSDKDNAVLLEKYFNDIYNLFLRKLSAFAVFENIDAENTLKLQALLQELIKVKKIMINRIDNREL